MRLMKKLQKVQKTLSSNICPSKNDAPRSGLKASLEQNSTDG